MSTTVAPGTAAWCVERGHPLLTWSPWINRTLCRCGQVRAAGEQPVDWEAKRQLFHPGHAADEPCHCYLPPAHGGGER